MSKSPLLAATAILGIVFVAGATQRVAVAEEAAIPSDHITCLVTGTTCTYKNNVGYWTGCEGAPQGWMRTSIAMIFCDEFHSGNP